MLKTIKLLTAAAILFAQSAFAGASFERVKEELWFKGESAVLSKATYEQLGQDSLSEIDAQSAWDAWQGTVVMPEELEAGLAMWVSQK